MCLTDLLDRLDGAKVGTMVVEGLNKDVKKQNDQIKQRMSAMPVGEYSHCVDYSLFPCTVIKSIIIVGKHNFEMLNMNHSAKYQILNPFY